MMIEHNEFRIKFGKMKDALSLWKEMIDEMSKIKDGPKVRIMTDITGPSYTLVVELQLRDFIHIGLKNYQWMSQEKVAQIYQQFVPLCESSVRTLYKIEQGN